jgi:hypothetical protein
VLGCAKILRTRILYKLVRRFKQRWCTFYILHMHFKVNLFCKWSRTLLINSYESHLNASLLAVNTEYSDDFDQVHVIKLGYENDNNHRSGIGRRAIQSPFPPPPPQYFAGDFKSRLCSGQQQLNPSRRQLIGVGFRHAGFLFSSLPKPNHLNIRLN